jgi:hypothetical protein
VLQLGQVIARVILIITGLALTDKIIDIDGFGVVGQQAHQEATGTHGDPPVKRDLIREQDISLGPTHGKDAFAIGVPLEGGAFNRMKTTVMTDNDNLVLIPEIVVAHTDPSATGWRTYMKSWQLMHGCSAEQSTGSNVALQVPEHSGE